MAAHCVALVAVSTKYCNTHVLGPTAVITFNGYTLTNQDVRSFAMPDVGGDSVDSGGDGGHDDDDG